MKIKKYLTLVVGAMVLCTSCVKDLDTVPMNEWDPTADNTYGADETAYIKGLGRIYKMLNSHNLTDLTGVDGGASETFRSFWACQEISADAAKVAWGGDAWTDAVNKNTWTDTENDVISGIYYRAMQTVAYANEYLRQTSADKLAERGVEADVQKRIAMYRDEARFLRAFYYWILVDCFGSVPFGTEADAVGTELPQASRVTIYNFIVSELEALTGENSNLPVDPEYPRAGKGAALGLLSRVYLNAEVYSGTPAWDKCKMTCEKLFQLNKYDLCSNYGDLFRGDNGQNPDALKELIFTADYDATVAQSYGGTSFLTLAATASTDIANFGCPTGVKGGWGGIRTTYEYAKMYFDVKDVDWTAGTYTCADARGQFFWLKDKVDEDTQKKIDKGELTLDEVILRHSSMKDELSQFKAGWTCWKYNNIPHDKTAEEFKETAASTDFASIDYPVIRLGEIYLTYAEACRELGQTATGLPYLAKLAERAGVSAPTAAQVEGDVNVKAESADANFAANVDFFIAERARELMWEGHRRTDLIRHNLFHSEAYLWPYKGGDSFNGQAFDAGRNVYPIPASQLRVYPGLSNPDIY